MVLALDARKLQNGLRLAQASIQIRRVLPREVAQAWVAILVSALGCHSSHHGFELVERGEWDNYHVRNQEAD